jgi:two-component system NtrC family sensor kinase
MRRTLLLLMVLVPAVPFFLTLGIGYSHFAGSVETSAVASMTRIVEDHRQMIDSFLQERRADLEFILHAYSFDELSDPQTLYDIFRNLQRISNAFVDLGLFNEEGLHLIYHGPFRLTGRDYGAEEWFRQVMGEGRYVSDVFLGYRQVPHFVMASKRTDSGRSWVLRATINTNLFHELVKRVRLGRTGEAYLVNGEGLLQTERRSGGRLMDREPPRPPHPPSDKETRISMQKDASGEEYLCATTWLTQKKWLLVLRQQKEDAYRALRTASYAILLIVTLGGLVIVGAAFYLTDRVVLRLEKADREREQLSSQLIRAARLAELGEMAAGFAHEINNPLQIMKTEQALIGTLFADLKRRGDLKDSEDLAEMQDSMQQIQIQIDRCSAITQAILKFGRQSRSAPERIDLTRFVPEVIAMVAKKAGGHSIRIVQDIYPDTPAVHVDPSSLQQVLINLLNNAMDAIVERHGSEGGEITIQARPGGNGKVNIAVTDNGIGIPPENLKRVFTPFFTTKPAGKGTGMGLSVCYGIVDSMGGALEVRSEKGVGTTFTIRLPGAEPRVSRQ